MDQAAVVDGQFKIPVLRQALPVVGNLKATVLLQTFGNFSEQTFPVLLHLTEKLFIYR